MATIHITLTDTPTGGVAIHSDFRPAIGAPCSPAQSEALEILRRTSRQWGLPADAQAPAPEATSSQVVT